MVNSQLATAKSKLVKIQTPPTILIFIVLLTGNCIGFIPHI